jgi:hypothetical protein
MGKDVQDSRRPAAVKLQNFDNKFHAGPLRSGRRNPTTHVAKVWFQEITGSTRTKTELASYLSFQATVPLINESVTGFA